MIPDKGTAWIEVSRWQEWWGEKTERGEWPYTESGDGAEVWLEKQVQLDISGVFDGS
jgi:hypothetical protein